MARRRSGQNFQQLQNTREYPGLSKQEVTDVMVQFKKAQQKPGSGLSLYDLVRLLRNMQYEVDEQKKNHLNSQLQQKEIRVIDLNTTLYFAAQLKKEKEQSRYSSEDQNNEYIDAFVALGGSSDTTGYISKSNLMHILKSEFELAVDLESLLNANSGAEIDDHLFFGQFKQLFDQQVEPTNRGSVLSILSKRGGEQVVPGTMKILQVDTKQFQRYLSKLQAGSN